MSAISSRRPRFAPFALAILAFVPIASARANFELVEDFEDLTPGSISGQNGWWSASSTLVAADPADGDNQVLAVTSLTTLVRKAMLIPQGTTRTMFLRFRFAQQLSGSFGLSYLAAPTEFDDFGPELSLTSASPDLRIADGTTTGVYQALTSLDAGTWYNAWLLVDNLLDTTQVWLHSAPEGSATASDMLSGDEGQDTFGFRVAGPRDMVNFYIKTGSGGAGEFGPLYIDDIYLENTGALNLFNPTAPPLPGDYNGNGTVDAADYAVWRDNFGATGVAGTLLGDGTTTGDLAGVPDGVVDQWDYDFWMQEYGNTVFGDGGVAAAAIPEPSAFIMLSAAMITAWVCRRRAASSRAG